MRKIPLICAILISLTVQVQALDAPGGPGAIGSWARPNKQGFLATLKQNVWATIAEGILTEVYYPSLDRAQTRDTQLVFLVNQTLLEERKHFIHQVKRYPDSLAYHVSSVNQNLQIKIEKDIILDSSQSSIILNYKVYVPPALQAQVYLLHNPSCDNTTGGDGVFIDQDKSLVAFQADRRGDEAETALRYRAKQVLSINHSVTESAVGFEGVNSPWNQLTQFGKITNPYQKALQGNISGALGFKTTAAVTSFKAVLSFKLETSPQDLLQLKKVNLYSHRAPLASHLSQQQIEWQGYLSSLNVLGQSPKMQPHILMLKGMEDKFHRGAIIAGPAKPSLPEAIESRETQYEEARLRKGDANGGYHRVWPRDLVHMGLAFIAVGDYPTAMSIARYLMRTQKPNGHFWQNTWVDGEPSWRGFQLDQTGFPIVLVAKLVETGLISYDEFRPLVLKAADALVRSGPLTEQERWEENKGLSPNSIAIACQGLLDAHRLERRYDPNRAQNYLNTCTRYKNNIFDWAFVQNGPLGQNYFERIHVGPEQDRSHSSLIKIHNNPVGGDTFLESEIIDGGFLQWIISGIFSGRDPRFTSSLMLYDRVARAATPGGLGYLRYNHDGYGEGHMGRAWPLLSGERALAALSRGEDPSPHTSVLYASVSPLTGVMCEQSGGVSVCPLGWSHAEAILVARSLMDRKSFYMPKIPYEQ